MIQIRRIVLPTDFSEQSRHALGYARSFAAEYGATLHVVHVVEAAVFFSQFVYDAVPFDPTLLLDGLEKERTRELSEWVAATGPGVEARGHLRRGGAAAEIVAAARELDADLLVIATHGRTGLQHVLFGSVAERVIRLAPCPCLVVRPKGAGQAEAGVGQRGTGS